MARETYYRVILSDLHMPEMDGIEFFREISQNYPKINHRFVIVTGGPTAQHNDFINANHLKVMMKPVKINTILETVRYIMQNSLNEQ